MKSAKGEDPREDTNSGPKVDLEAGHKQSTAGGPSKGVESKDVTLVRPTSPPFISLGYRQPQVTWNGPEDPDNPKNWPTTKKWRAAVLVSFFTFISPVSSSMVAPALERIAVEFKITDDVLLELTLSTFVLAYAVGPLFLGPLSEIYGRKIILQLTNLFYIVFNVACGVSKSTGQMIAFRFLAGLGGSAPLAVSERFFVI
jgi:hypothetical protein